MKSATQKHTTVPM